VTASLVVLRLLGSSAIVVLLTKSLCPVFT
jgi:hypothetical protein